MNELWDRILRGKEEMRRRRAALSFEEKIAMVEKMRDRDLLIRSASAALRRDKFRLR
ncbi:MAG TPA: hypothetical protein VGN61_15340 [Verrucomicrobiae bacterium]|jgi:hypothetical protein